MLQKVIDTLLDVPPGIALLIVAGLVFAEAALFFGFVLPGETAVVYGGVLAAAGKMPVVLVLAVVLVAAVVGDSVGFEVGRKLGPRLVRAPVLRNHPDRFEEAQAYLRRRGGRAVVMGRFTAFLRAVDAGPGRCEPDGVPPLPLLQRDRRCDLGQRVRAARLLRGPLDQHDQPRPRGDQWRDRRVHRRRAALGLAPATYPR